ncbi:hypothetical protein DMUE_0012 [Dictyocoela muelleri]|nr:hypothetical protein DMUE_0012 [Dictyocoela muelleri]
MDHEYFSYISSNDSIIELFKVFGAISSSKKCQACMGNIKMIKNTRSSLEYIWRRNICFNENKILSNCSLKSTKISPFVFLKFAFYFYNKNNFSANYVMENTGIGEEMYKKILSLFRSKISQYVKNNKRQLGGTLNEVQIDETFWARQKYGYGDPGIATWIFGAVEYDTGYCWVERVENRRKNTLLPIISREIHSKSYVISDRWSAYSSIPHKNTDSVCHKYNFVDPETRADTQMIENLWMHLKKIKHYSYGISLKTLPDHLNVFMFFRNYKNIKLSNFIEIILN